MGKRWTRKKLIKSYLEFFKSKNHKVMPSASLVPENDPTVLFTTAGMHPLVPHLLGQKHPLGKRIANVQKCVRTTDIEEVGNKTHHTFFEMLGNWSLGDYWKKKAIEYTFEFHTKVLKIPLSHYAVSCFKGDKQIGVPKDIESGRIWKNLGVKKERIAFLGKRDNWWGPAGETGPCGPDTEQFFWIGKRNPPEKFNPKDKNWVEIGNDVLMQYIKDEKGNFKEAKQKNVDFGGGVERTVAVLNGLSDNYLADMWKPIIEEIEKISGKEYGSDKETTRAMRIVADHVKAAVFIIADGVKPGNKERGYILRRLIRRAIKYGRFNLGLKGFFTDRVAKPVFKIYEEDYPELKRNKERILKGDTRGILISEENKFSKTLERGMKKLKSIIYIRERHKRKSGKKSWKNAKKEIKGEEAFLLYQSYGFPIELTKEIAKEKGFSVDMKGFEKETEKHKKLSQTATEGKFASGLADHSEKTTKLHTATHLLNESLRQTLDKNIKQKGSNITPERLRFDFNFPRKLTKEEIKKVEDLVNKKISEGLKVTSEEMPLKKALQSGAQSEFGAKYPNVVSVYTIGPKEKPFSKEICAGPHVKNTGEIGRFKIIKEQSSSAGVRRIKAVVKGD